MTAALLGSDGEGEPPCTEGNGVKAHLRSTWGFDEIQDVSHKGKQAVAPEHAAWRHLYVDPRQLRAEEVPRAAREAFEPGYEALAIEVVYDEDLSEQIRRLRDRLPPTFDDARGHRWHRIGTSPISRDRVRVTLATPPSLRSSMRRRG